MKPLNLSSPLVWNMPLRFQPMPPLFENQAFGAVEFACTLVWKDNPELESKLISKWNDEWKNLFTQLYA